MDDEHLYARVVAELAASGPIAGLMAKCFAESGGNDAAARALYFKLRVAQLARSEESDSRARATEAAMQRAMRQEAEAEAKSAEAKALAEQTPLMTKELWQFVFWVIVFAVVVGGLSTAIRS